MRYVNLKTGKNKWISEYEAYIIKKKYLGSEDSTPGITTKESPDEYFRTAGFIIYYPTKKELYETEIRTRRLAALLAQKTDSNILLIKNKLFKKTKNLKTLVYIVADQVKNKKELEYHQNTTRIKPEEVISLKPSKTSPYFVLDEKITQNYYKNKFSFGWFLPFTKHRHFRATKKNMKWIFANRRLTDSPSSTTTQKFGRAFHNAAKIYYSSNRCLDSKKEACGEGRPINLMLAVLDVDANKGHACEITKDGTCTLCMQEASDKLRKIKTRLKKKGITPWKIIFSGSRGFHVYPYPYEISEEQYLKLLNYINKEEPLADDFSYKKNGKQKWDSHRIWKVPNSIDATTACKIKELPLERLPVKDAIITP